MISSNVFIFSPCRDGYLEKQRKVQVCVLFFFTMLPLLCVDFPCSFSLIIPLHCVNSSFTPRISEILGLKHAQFAAFPPHPRVAAAHVFMDKGYPPKGDSDMIVLNALCVVFYQGIDKAPDKNNLLLQP